MTFMTLLWGFRAHHHCFSPLSLRWWVFNLVTFASGHKEIISCDNLADLWCCHLMSSAVNHPRVHPSFWHLSEPLCDWSAGVQRTTRAKFARRIWSDKSVFRLTKALRGSNSACIPFNESNLLVQQGCQSCSVLKFNVAQLLPQHDLATCCID